MTSDYGTIDSEATECLGSIIDAIQDTGAEVSTADDLESHDSRSVYAMNGDKVRPYYRVELDITFTPNDMDITIEHNDMEQYDHD